ncbi:reverse transcriptase [Senna tora]|uniref:Reverse transcriptase n=1 Tax=Senna tora TaxID=362788 RepID=A0A834VXE1_9FABA|nr:reverse transcriptase [Senna tora]
MGFPHSHVVESQRRSGGLALFWKNGVDVTISSSCANYIHTVLIIGNSCFSATWTYGHPDFQHRRYLWDIISNLPKKHISYWLCLGDFNEFLSQEEKEGLRLHSNSQIQLFRDFTDANHLIDVKLNGCRFTWSNNREEGCVKEKIDRLLITTDLHLRFPNLVATALPAIGFDHSPLIVQLDPPFVCRKSGAFRTEYFWEDHEDNEKVVDDSWKSSIGDSSWDFWCNASTNLSSSLTNWSKNTFKRADKQITKLKVEAMYLQKSRASAENTRKLKDCKKAIDKLWEQEEKFWQARSRIQWLRGGDTNSHFFHASTMARRVHNRVSRIRTPSDHPPLHVDIHDFIPKLINDQDNVNLNRAEAFHFLHSSKGRNSNSMIIKLDMNKAFDRMEWSFIHQVLKAYGFYDHWINLIQGCFSTANYQVKVNGVLGDKIIPERGLHQGNPLSPYLFILGADVLFRMITKATLEGTISGIKLARSAPPLSHLFFADDAMIMMKASLAEAYELQRILNVYCSISGQKINISKSKIVFSKGIDPSIKHNVANALQMQIWDNPGKYLGLPGVWGRAKSNALSWIKDKIWNKLQGWKENFLNPVGKEVLIKAVIQAIPSYAMAVNPSESKLALFESAAGDLFPRNIYLASEIEKRELVDLEEYLGGQKPYSETPLVKTGYNKAVEDLSSVPSTNNINSHSLIWKSLWTAKVAPKIKAFMWRLCNNVIPTATNIHKRLKHRSPSCFICGAEEETAAHVFLECPWVHAVWFGIWTTQNKFIFEGAPIHPSTVVFKAFSDANEFWNASAPPPTVQAAPTRPTRWTRLEFNTLKLNIDASTDLSRNHGASAVIIRDHEGMLLTGSARTFHCSSPIQAETEALRDASALISSLNLHNVIIESDCLNLKWIRREANRVADLVARLALKKDLPIHWSWSPLVSVRAAILEDKIRSSSAVDST